MMHPLSFVSIKERVRLNHPSSEKQTYHIVLDLKGSGIHYAVGDCIAVYPPNPTELINKILNLLQVKGSVEVKDREGRSSSFFSYLKYRANLARTTSKLCALLAIGETTLSPIELLQQAHSIAPQLLVDALAPNMPRLYSIASAMREVGEEAHLIVGLTSFEKEGILHFGTCSQFLCHHAALNEPSLLVYHHKAKDFTLSEESFTRPMIMVGPGTGIAPFRGFMQERMHYSQTKNWLFFGERNSHSDFYYEDFWKKLAHQGKLKLDVAFSRDQPEKIYVQHKLKERGSEVWQWLNEGGLFCVCGDAEKMAKQVDEALCDIVQEHGKMTPDSAKNYLKTLRKEKRYLRDVY